jgi:polysaccharide export outer membrane protein
METAAVTPPIPAPAPSAPLRSRGEIFSADPAYRLGPEDVVHVSVWESKELTTDVTVRPDGKVSLPLINDIQAAGLTPAELANVIRQKLLVYIKDPHVTVVVTQLIATKIYVMGNVLKPGNYPLRQEMNVLQALSLAGGFTTFASPRNIKLIRGTGNGREILKINYYKLI